MFMSIPNNNYSLFDNNLNYTVPMTIDLGSLIMGKGALDKIKGLYARINALGANNNCSWLENRSPCERTELYKYLMGYCFPLMFFICIFGNSMNILVYSSRNMRQSLAVKILAVKALMNSLFVISLLPNALRILTTWQPGSQIEFLFWSTWPYVLFLANFFGTCAMWITVVMTLERYLYVAFPMNSRQWCTTKNFRRCLCVLFPAAACLQAVYPITRKAVVVKCREKTFYQFKMKPGSWYLVYDRWYHLLNLLFVIVIPLILLILMTAVISYKLLHRPVNTRLRHTNHQYRCITRITLTTTAAQVILESPAAFIFVMAAIKGPQMVNDWTFLCSWHSIANFLGLCNSSLLFFIYLLLSGRFRELFFLRISCYTWATNDQLLATEGALHTRNRTTVGTSRSNCANARTVSENGHFSIEMRSLLVGQENNQNKQAEELI